jgi:hypothetical protein
MTRRRRQLDPIEFAPDDDVLSEEPEQDPMRPQLRPGEAAAIMSQVGVASPPVRPSATPSPLGPLLRPGQAGEVMSQVGVASPVRSPPASGAAPDGPAPNSRFLRDGAPPQDPPPPPPRQMPPGLAAEAERAQQIGDAYRERVGRDPDAFGLSAYVADGGRREPPPAPLPPAAPMGPQEGAYPPAGGEIGAEAQAMPGQLRERLAAALRARQAQPEASTPPPQAAQPGGSEVPPQQSAEAPASRPEPDYTGADWSDALRRPFHAIGAALTAATGGRAPAMRSARDRQRAEYEAAVQRDERQAGATSGRDIAERRMALAEQQADDQYDDREAQREDRASQRSMQERALELREALEERRMALAEQQGQMAMQVSQARLGQIESEAERERAAGDPTSEPSRLARVGIRTALAGYPAEARERLEQQFGGADTLEGVIGEEGTLTAGMAPRLMQELHQMFRDLSHRRTAARGGGGGRGGARRADAAPVGAETDAAAYGTDEDPLVREAIRFGLNADLARQMARDTSGGRSSGRRRLQSQVATESAQRGRLAQYAIIDGWERDPSNATLLTPGESRDLNRVTVADREFSANVTELERLLTGLGADERVAGRFRTGSEAYYEVQHRLEVIRNQLRQISQMGNSLGAQQAIEHAVPSLDDNVTAGSILRNVRAAYRTKNDYVTALLGNYGYTRRGGGGGHGGGHGGGGGGGGRGRAAPQPQPQTGGTVRVRLPDGRIGTIPRANLQRATAAGAQEVR